MIEVIKMIEEGEPTVTIAVPPSDNKRLIWQSKLRRFILSNEARKFRDEYSQLRPMMPEPPCILAYKIYKKRERDSSNIVKLMLDTLYKEDKQVYPWCLPPDVDKKEPRVDIWIHRLEGE